METFFLIIALLAMMFAFYFGFFWISEKFLGVRFHGRFEGGRAFAQSEREKAYLRLLSVSNPNLVTEAINRCKKKKFRLTASNILSEVQRIEKENSTHDNFAYKLNSKARNLISSIKNQNSLTKIEKIERLNKLKENGLINELEFEHLKNEIIDIK